MSTGKVYWLCKDHQTGPHICKLSYESAEISHSEHYTECSKAAFLMGKAIISAQNKEKELKKEQVQLLLK